VGNSALSVIAAVLCVGALVSSTATASGSPALSCPVTIPTRTADGSAGPGGFNYGSTKLKAELYWPRGTLPAGILPDGGSYASVLDDGSIWLKLGWWRGLAGKLVITGHRLDHPAPPLRAEVPDGYGPRGFVPSGLTFPTVGCWRVQSRLGPARLAFVVRVVKLKRLR
jgi:hypothetical protein